MEIFMRNIPYTSDQLKVTLLLEPILHSPLFDPFATSPGLPINFKVFLFANKRGRGGHSGCGTLTLPSTQIGSTFLAFFGGLVSPRPISVDGRPIIFEKSRKEPRPDILGEISLMPWRDPRAIQEKEERLENLSGYVMLQDVQFAWQCRDDSLSIEWQWNPRLRDKISGAELTLRFNDETREVQIMRMVGKETYKIVMRYSRIRSVDTDSSEHTIVLILETPPSFELAFLPGKREKLTHLDSAHASTAPFIWSTLRLVCSSLSDLAEFKRMADVANLQLQDRRYPAVYRGLFSPSIQAQMQVWLRSLDWRVGFQCEALHRYLLLDTRELLELRQDITGIVATHGAEHAVQVFRQFGLQLRSLWSREFEETVRSCFERAKSVVQQTSSSPLENSTSNQGVFQCLHVNFTPTTMILRGPFPDTSNRILRRYPNHHDCFLRVSFTDEDRLKFRFDHREVDGPGFIDKHVGGKLRKGFEICGRKFEFLAYSQSALKEYTVWFVTPFMDGKKYVNAERIRANIGSEWPKDVRQCPARFAARLSQAFTATESSVLVEQDQIEKMPDIERNGYCFSDGNGPLSPDMADAIQDALQKGAGRTNHGRRAPSVFQIRIQGAKGVLCVDPTLSGLKIGLRPSMVKFESRDSHNVEVARSFNKPGKMFLNRPLAMILAGLGVDVKVFIGLQRDAVLETADSSTSLKGAARLLETHGLGSAFAIPSTLLNLRKLGLEWRDDSSPSSIKDAFAKRAMQFAVNHVLREMKYRARIPVPDGWKLVGVVDIHDILEPDEIYACIVRGEGATHEYLSGPILLSKSPTIHPGDVRMARAIGAPPVGSPLIALTNCVVFSQRGDRPLPNKLSGSDLDGDEYDLITLQSLHPPYFSDPGEYPPAPKKRLARDSTIEDVAEFVVDFINNDMLGIIATNFLLIADQEPEGIFHPFCLTLAELHSWAVDFAKSGVPVPLGKIPLPKIRIKPDWHAPEIAFNLTADFYESKSVLGQLFRDIKLPPLSAASHDSRAQRSQRKRKKNISLEETLETLSLDLDTFNDPITVRLGRRLRPLVNLELTDELTTAIVNLFDHFAAELEHICFSYTLSRKATARLTEEEVFMGTIIAKSSQPRMRKDTISGMREESTILVRRILKELEGGEQAPIKDWVNRAWTAWKISLMKEGSYGSKSFGWIALRAIFEAIKYLDAEDN